MTRNRGAGEAPLVCGRGAAVETPCNQVRSLAKGFMLGKRERGKAGKRETGRKEDRERFSFSSDGAFPISILAQWVSPAGVGILSWLCSFDVLASVFPGFGFQVVACVATVLNLWKSSRASALSLTSRKSASRPASILVLCAASHFSRSCVMARSRWSNLALSILTLCRAVAKAR